MRPTNLRVLALTTWLLLVALASVLTLLTPAGWAEAQAEVPAEPTGLEATEVAHDRVGLAWDDPGDDSITGYQVLRRSVDRDEYGDGKGPAEFTAVVDDTGSAATTYTDTTVTSRARYVYRVKARNAAGLSWHSRYLNVRTPGVGTPTNDPPRFPAATAARSVPENSAAMTAVGAPVAATDPDHAALSYRLSGEAAGTFTIDSSGQLSVADDTTLDHETVPDLTLTVTASDPYGASASVEVAITVTDVWDPSVLLIVADDVSAGVFGTYGSKRYKTPRIDEIAAAGARFANAHANPCCTGSRLELMTGKSNVRNYRDVGELPESEYTFLDLMDSGGYRTGAAGKWGLHGGSEATGTQPEDKIQTYCLWNTRNTETLIEDASPRYWGAWIDCDGEVTKSASTEYGPDLHVNFLLDFIAANRNRPFLAYYPMVLAHAPLVDPPVKTCRPKAGDQCRYKDMVGYLDRNVGLLYDKLGELEILDNTVLLFTADNTTRHDFITELGGVAALGEKATTLDGGTRVPLIVHAPGVEGGRVVEDLASLTDVLPTLADATGLVIPDRDQLDGVSFWERLQGDGGAPREWLYTYYFPRPYVAMFSTPRFHPQAAWTRNIRYKLYDTGDLFDVLADPNEVRPLPEEDTASAPARVTLQNALDSMPDRGQAIDWDQVVAPMRDLRRRWRPVFAYAAVVGPELTLKYAGMLDPGATPANDSYTVQVDGAERPVAGVTVERQFVTVTLASPVTSGQTVTVSYEPGEGAVRRLWAAQVASAGADLAAAINDAKASNETPPKGPAAGAPAIDGAPRTGATLTADVSAVWDPDGMTGAAILYQWIRTNGTTDTGIADATEQSYVPVEADEGNAIKVRVSFTDDGGNAETLFSEATATIEPNTPATGAPAITGRAQVGEPLTADTSGINDADGMTNPGFTYQWLVDGDAEIPDATESRYVPAAEHEGKAFKVRVSFADDGGFQETLTSAATPAARRANNPATGLPSIIGTSRVGETQLADVSGIADADGMTQAILSYQWVGNGRDIRGATGAGYTPAFADEGKYVQVRVSFTDDAGNREILTSEGVSLEPHPRTPPGELTATVSDGSVALGWRAPVDAYVVTAYRILRHRPEEGEPEPLVHVAFTDTNATAYTDTAVASGTLYVYRVQAADYLGVLGPASDPVSARVIGGNTPASGAPAVDGAPRVGETLAADTSGISDADGMDGAAFRYRWLRSNGPDYDDIPDETSSAYLLQTGDEGRTIKVRVSFVDDNGHDETLVSAPTAAVAKPLLTAGFESVPEDHTGDEFTILLTFSEEFPVTERRIRARLTVAGGSVETVARATAGENRRWTIAIAPSEGAVSISLTPSADCQQSDAICAPDGRNLSEAAAALVQERAATQVVDAGITSSPGPNGSWDAGETVTAQVTFNRNIAAHGPEGSRPALMIALDGKRRPAELTTTGASDTLTFTYTITGNENGANSAEIVTNGIVLNRHSLRDNHGEEAGICLSGAGGDGAQAPNAPDGLAAPHVSQSGVTLEWDDPEDDNVTGYRILRRHIVNDPPGSFTEVTGNTCSVGASYTDRTVEPGTRYAYRIQALNDERIGSRSGYVNVEVPTGESEATAPEAPTGLSAGAVSQTSVTISWDDPGDDSITGYRVLRRDLDGSSPDTLNTIVEDTGTAATSQTDATVAAGSRYSYRVVALNGVGESEQSDALTVETPPALPARPTGLSASDVTHESVTLGWDDPDDDSITGYRVLRRDIANDPPGVFATVAGDTGSAAASYTDTTVSAETRYTYRVVAVNVTGESPRSGYVNVETSEAPANDPPPQNDPPGRPTGLQAAAISHDSVTLGWDDPGDSTISGYRILRRDIVNDPPGTFSTVASNTGSAATSYTDSTVAASTRYAYRVAALNANGASPRSGYVNVTTGDAP